MLIIDIPGAKPLHLEVLILDFNGTLALDGILLEGVEEDIQKLSGKLEIHILTSDTFGTVRNQCQALPVHIKVLESYNHTEEKAAFLRQFNPSSAVAVGNGANDLRMLQEAALSMVVIGPEGCSGKALAAADVIVKSISDALGLLNHPQRLIATLRT